MNAAANELHNDKQLCIQLAREHGLLEAYASALKVGSWQLATAAVLGMRQWLPRRCIGKGRSAACLQPLEAT